jgi:hypothetical protein
MICSQCNQDKGNRRKCKECNRRYQKKWYENNKELQTKRVQANTERYKVISREWLYRYLETHPCVDCGLIDPLVMHFDHRDRATKKATVSYLMCHGASLESIQKEVAKCDVRCANCHTRRTAEQLGWAKYFMGEGR